MVYSDSTNALATTKFVVDSVNGPFKTIQAAINECVLEGGGLVFVRRGTYAEDLTLSTLVDIQGENYDSIIVGTHAIPVAVSGIIRFRNLALVSTGNIFEVANATTLDLEVSEAEFRLTAGFILQLNDSMTGVFTIDNCIDTSARNGIVDSSTYTNLAVNIKNSQVGVNTTAMVLRTSESFITNCEISCPIEVRSAGDLKIKNCSEINRDITLVDGSSATICNSLFSTLGNSIDIDLGSTLFLQNTTIESIATPVISGDGTVYLGDVTFPINKAIENTVSIVNYATTSKAYPFVVGPTGIYGTIQEAINFADDIGDPQTIFIQNGTYTENLSLKTNIKLVGMGNNVIISGLHIPPATGTIEIENVKLINAGDIFSTAVAGSTDIYIRNCTIDSSGYILNLDNWTGDIYLYEINDISASDKIIKKSASSSNIYIYDCEQLGGDGSVQSDINGFLLIENSNIANILNTAGSSIIELDNCSCTCQFVINGSSALIIRNSDLYYINAVINNSSAQVKLYDVDIYSEANPVITGTGTTYMSNVSFSYTGKSIASTQKAVQIKNTLCTYNYNVGATGKYTTIQKAISDANAAGGSNIIFIQEGTYTESLTLYDGIKLVGLGTQTIIHGDHTPPTTGSVYFENLKLSSGTDIISSGSAGITDFYFTDCTFDAVAYLLDIDGWGGTITFKNCNDISSGSTIMKNTGGSATASIVAYNCPSLGDSASAITVQADDIIIDSSVINNALTLRSGSAYISNSTINKTLTFDAGTDGTVVASKIYGASIAGSGDQYLEGVEFSTGYYTIAPISGAAVIPALAPLNDQTGTTYTVTISDLNKTVTLSNANPITLTLPQNSTENLPIGFQCTLIQKGAGQVTVAVEGSDNLRSADGLTKLRTTYSAATVIKVASGEWYLSGDLTV